MEYIKKLVDEINKYDGTDESMNRLRTFVCYLSDKKKYRDDPLSRSILFDAALIMRTFGYNVQNKITIDEVWSKNNFDDIKNQAIHRYYNSKVYPEALIDRRQKEIIDSFNTLDIKRLIVSAPTSFGKTFILREILFANRERYKNILLVFPTVALLNENSIVINKLIKDFHLNYTVINNVYSKIEISNHNIYILTPERTLKLLADYEKLNIDFFFFDEVYKIDEDFNRDEDNSKSENSNAEYLDEKNIKNRAKAFRIALYILSKKVKEYYIVGPYLDFKNVKNGFSKYLAANKITVKQIEFEPTLKIEVDASKKRGTEFDPIKGNTTIDFDYDGPISTKRKIKALLSYIDKNKLGQAIIYCATPSNSMTYAKEIILNLPHNDNIIEKHRDFIDHLRRRYGIKHIVKGERINSSEYWSLIKILSAGFGVHHGKFPKYIQREILDMFNKGDIEYLFCTSTIIEGVNTNAKNVIILNNKLGSRKMTSFALKNIRGRAGRYYHHFVGRVFYTNEEQREIERQDDIKLNFSIYDEPPITKVDYDNSEINDLSIPNERTKASREKSFNKEKFPDSIFIKNRLFARDTQEFYLQYLITNLITFLPLISQPGNIPYFVKNNFMSHILKSLAHVGIITDNEEKVYWAISDTYSNKHFEGLLKFQLDKVMNLEKDIDEAYRIVFTQIRNIIEYEIPRLLSLFESIFKQACILNGYEVDAFDMTSIIRFFELGVRTHLGIFLVEYGFPVEGIRDIENSIAELSKMELSEGISFAKANIAKLDRVLDLYERRLLRLSLESY